jgi:GT2 family glycosyltransferase
MPTVSICIPAYNAASFIGQTLDTCLNQTYQDFEIIVSDNHSTDGTPDIVKRYQEKDSRVSLTSCPIRFQESSLLSMSLGSIDNMNHLIFLAESEFIALYHADDMYHSNILTEELAFLHRHDRVSAVFTMGLLTDCDGKRVSSRSPVLPSALNGKKIFDYNELLDALIEHKMQLMTPSCLMRRKAVVQAGPILKRYEQAADYDYWLQLAKTGPIGVIDRTLFLRRVSKQQGVWWGRTLYRNKHLPSVSLFEDHVLALPDANPDKPRLLNSIQMMKIDQDFRVASNLILNGENLEAIRTIKRSINSIQNQACLNWRLRTNAFLIWIGTKLGLAKFFIIGKQRLLQTLRSVKWRMRSLKPSDLGL